MGALLRDAQSHLQLADPRPAEPRPVAGAHQRAVAAPGRQPDRPVRIRPQRRQDPHGPRYLRPTGEHPRHRRNTTSVVRRDMGRSKTQRFLRYYEIPGYGHAASTVFNAAWDSLSALEDWVEQGIRRAGRSLPTASACPAAPARCANTPAEVRRQGRRQCRHKLRLRAEPQGHPLASEPAPAPRPAPPQPSAALDSLLAKLAARYMSSQPDASHAATAPMQCDAQALWHAPSSRTATSATGTPFALCL